MRPVPCVVGTVVTIQHVIARILKELRGELGFRHVPPDLGVGFAGQRAPPQALGLGDHAVAQRDWEILTAGGLDGLHDLRRKAVSVLQRAAVLVSAVVHILECELVEQISLVHRVHLHAVHARRLEQCGALGKRIDDRLNLRLRHLAGGHPVGPAVFRRAGGGGDLVEVHEGPGENAQRRVGVEHFHHAADGEGAPKARRQLNEQLRSGLVELRHPARQLVEHPRVLVQPLAEHGVVHRLAARQHQTDVVFRHLHQEVRTGAVKVVHLHPAKQIRSAHRGHDNAVFDFDLPDFPRGKQRLQPFIHRFSSILRSISAGHSANVNHASGSS